MRNDTDKLGVFEETTVKMKTFLFFPVFISHMYITAE